MPTTPHTPRLSSVLTRKSAGFLAACVIGVSLLAGVPMQAQAQAVVSGYVAASIPCTCSGNFLLYVIGANGGQYSYYMGTQAYLSYNLPRPGVWILGLYSPGAICLQYAGVGCSSFGSPTGTILPTVGTSP